MDAKKNNQSLIFGVLGLGLQMGGLCFAPDLAIAFGIPRDLAWVGLLIVSALGTALLIWALALYAQSKEQSGWFGLLGVFGVFGLLVLGTLPDRHAQRNRGKGVNIRAQPTASATLCYCLGCDYPLNGIASGTCPECGHGFDPDDLRTVRLEGEEREKTPPVARWSVYWGVIALCLACIPLANVVIALIGLVVSNRAHREAKNHPLKRGLTAAIIGLVLNNIVFYGSLIWSAYFFFFFVN